MARSYLASLSICLNLSFCTGGHVEIAAKLIQDGVSYISKETANASPETLAQVLNTWVQENTDKPEVGKFILEVFYNQKKKKPDSLDLDPQYGFNVVLRELPTESKLYAYCAAGLDLTHCHKAQLAA